MRKHLTPALAIALTAASISVACKPNPGPPAQAPTGSTAIARAPRAAPSGRRASFASGRSRSGGNQLPKEPPTRIASGGAAKADRDERGTRLGRRPGRAEPGRPVPNDERQVRDNLKREMHAILKAVHEDIQYAR